MLSALHIENVAVIKSADIDFFSGFTALTGETGAGKSIIIDSINLLLGEKADRELIRNGAEGLMVSGLFSGIDEKMIDSAAEYGVYPDDEGNILIQRSVGRDGKSSVKINGRSVSLTLLKNVVPRLISIHGQNDTRVLSDSKNHIHLLDSYSANADLLDEYSREYSEYEKTEREIEAISGKESERLRMLEMLRYQIQDIESVKLKVGEEDILTEKKLKIKNSERIIKHAGFVYKALKGSEKGSVSYLVDRSIASLEQLADVIPECKDYVQTLYDFLYRIDDIAENVASYGEDAEESTEDALNRIEERLDKISKLKRKYGADIEQILAYLKKIKGEEEALANADSTLEDLKKKRAALRESLMSRASKLNAIRCESAPQVEEKIRKILSFLDMPKTDFRIMITKEYSDGEIKFNRYGYDLVEFYIRINSGAELQPLSKIASGGEMARIMLAIKSVINDKEGTPTVVFDEIDAGVSGKTARKIGIKLLHLSRTVQVMCVTHSAQIASLGDWHYLIKKQDVNGETSTSVETLGFDERIDELSRILGGISITASQRSAAEDMLREKDIYVQNEG